MPGRCPRCGRVGDLSADNGRTRQFWSAPLCLGCRAVLGSTGVDDLLSILGWLGPGTGIRTDQQRIDIAHALAEIDEYQMEQP